MKTYTHTCLALWCLPMISVVALAQSLPATGHESDARLRGQTREHPLRPSAWFGATFSPVPDMVAVHIGLGHGPAIQTGIIVLNVVVDGPADRAGLDRFDVIVAVNDSRVPRDLHAFVEATRRHRPGDIVQLTIIRRGQREQVDLTLSEPVDPDQRKYKYAREHVSVTKKRRARPHIWRKGKDGWQEVPPQTIPNDLAIPDRLRQHLDEQALSGPKFKISQRRGNREMLIERGDDGHITVTRIEKNEAGEELIRESTEFENEEALIAKDPQAFRLYTSGSMMTEGVASGRGAEKRRYVEQLRDRMRHRRQRRNLRARPDGEPEHRPNMGPRSSRRSMPEHKIRFDVDEQGRIDVQIQRNNRELIISFRDEDEFRIKAPRLFQRYKHMYTPEDDESRRGIPEHKTRSDDVDEQGRIDLHLPRENREVTIKCQDEEEFRIKALASSYSTTWTHPLLEFAEFLLGKGRPFRPFHNQPSESSLWL